MRRGSHRLILRDKVREMVGFDGRINDEIIALCSNSSQTVTTGCAIQINHSVVMCSLGYSCLDYCNSLLYGIADIELTRFQNQLAGFVTKYPPFIRSLSLLCSLHWLPVRLRIMF